MVAFLAAEIALPLNKDKKFGMTMRRENFGILKQKLELARVANGNEAWSSSDFATDWIRFRRTGYGNWGGEAGGSGVLGYGWDSCGGWDMGGNDSAY